ncbi:hypothetical protein [Nitrososphaera viennensis]|mgnify:CR=1 FL=1|uniref:Uncharacterized protein n=1 Tax=Nitrososphaera viennensis TaxID=1034015 RepID=A0A977IF79_9ARCH|nr:hypothetical protein [Nitrososphaera viennensis]UVS69623.1 hypothetical protein NWT39_02270 [Nitrososphaera viennensis]
MVGWLVISLAIIPLYLYFFFTTARVTIHGTSADCGQECGTESTTTPSNMSIHYATKDEVAGISHDLEPGFSTAGSCSGGGTKDCIVFPKLNVYQATQLKDTFNLKENPQCIQGYDDDNHCGIVKYGTIYHRVGIKMPYDRLFNYYLSYSAPMALVGTAAIVVLWKRNRFSKRLERTKEEKEE